MIIIRYYVAIFVSLLSCVIVTVDEISAAIINSYSPSYSDVSNAVKIANPGDVVVIASGNATWINQLVITKNISLIGAGVGKTIITSNYNATSPTNSINSGNWLIVFNPTSPSSSQVFRLSGIEINTSGKCGAFIGINLSVNTPANVRIDHNKFTDSTSTYKMNCGAIYFYGVLYGVVDHNSIIMPQNHNQTLEIAGAGKPSWDNVSYFYGTSNALFFEDNSFSTYGGGFMNGGGSTTCFRYNTINHISTSSNMAFIDMHGNMGTGANYGTMGTEIYGNKIVSSGSRSVLMWGQRGGMSLCYWNYGNTSGGITSKSREEYIDEQNPTINNPSSTSPSGLPQKISNSYYWNNRNGASLIYSSDISESKTSSGGGNSYIDCSTCNFRTGYFQDGNGVYLLSVRLRSGTINEETRAIVGNTATRIIVEPDWKVVPVNGEIFKIVDDYSGQLDIVRENREYFNHNTTFDGSSGVGCGAIERRPTTCTTGVAYWATEQSCSEVNANSVGINPATPVNGVLYKCTATNTWVEYYKPYTYPHPLVKLQSPQGIMISQ